MFDQDHFERLKESIGICISKAYQDIEESNLSIQEILKKQVSPMELLQVVEKNLFNYCGLAEQ